jgi:hypothetical protein
VKLSTPEDNEGENQEDLDLDDNVFNMIPKVCYTKERIVKLDFLKIKIPSL